MENALSFADLPHEKLVALCKHYENERNHHVAINNELLKRLGALSDFSGSALDIFNEWSLVCNDLAEASAQEIQRIILINRTQMN